MKLDTLEEVLESHIRDLYSAECQLIKMFPRISKRASSVTLKDALESHFLETARHANKLKTLAAKMGMRATGKKCRAMEGLLADLKDVVTAEGRDCAVDAALTSMMQRIEHFEISAYGAARELALQLGYEDIVRILQEILEEESVADEKFASICSDEVLPECSEIDEDDEGNFKRPLPRLSDEITD